MRFTYSDANMKHQYLEGAEALIRFERMSGALFRVPKTATTEKQVPKKPRKRSSTSKG